MPTLYKRKGAVERRKWTKENPDSFIEEIKCHGSSLRKAEREHGVPVRTFKRWIEQNKNGPTRLGPDCVYLPWDMKMRQKLVVHMKELCDARFPFDRRKLRELAYQFPASLKVKHRFNTEKRMAGTDWLASFMRRQARAQFLSREKVEEFCNLLECELDKYKNLKRYVINVDEFGLQLINHDGKVIAPKRSRAVQKITTGERGETVTIVAVCTANGRFSRLL